MIIGDSSVGKSSLVAKYMDDYYWGDHLATVGVDFKWNKIEKDGKKFNLNIWDTGGQERFKSITKSYYHGAQAIILVYDWTWEESFISLPNWLQTIDDWAEDNVIKVLVANKSDMDWKISIPHKTGKSFANENDFYFIDCSAKTGANISKVFDKVRKFQQFSQ